MEEEIGCCCPEVLVGIMNGDPKKDQEILNNLLGRDHRFHLSERKKLRSCPRCSGTGIVSEEEMTDYHRNEYSTSYDACRVCKGQGRLVDTVHSVLLYGSSGVGPAKLEKVVSTVPYGEDPITALEDLTYYHYFVHQIESK